MLEIVDSGEDGENECEVEKGFEEERGRLDELEVGGI